MKTNQIKHAINIIILIVIPAFVFLLCSCEGGESFSNDTGYRTGSIQINLAWGIPPQQLTGSAPSGDVCEDYAIDMVTVTVIDSSDSVVASESWPCSAHTGTIETVSEGSGITISISGFVADNADWQGQVTGISVVGGQNTDIGTVVMQYTGDDETPPSVISHFPASDATDVPLNSAIEAKFSEDVVSASAKSAIALVGTTTVDGNVTYDSSTLTVSFVPESDLDADTSYSMTITADIEDFAGQHMTEPFSWNFTTGNETDIISPTNPILLNVTATSHSQIDLSWEASSDNIGVVKYHIYRDDSFLKSVSTTSATDTNLSPATNYCYAITALDSAGNESGLSNEICEQTQSAPPPSVPTLISPQDGAELDNGCPTSPDGITWNFDWSDAANATKYHIYVVHPGLNPLIDTEVISSSYEFTKSSYVMDDVRIGWTWKVRSGNDYGQWSAWSQERNFDVEESNTDCP